VIKRLFTVVAAASALLLTACTAAPAPAAAPQDAEVVVAFVDFDYAPQRLEAAAGEPLRVHLRNDGAIVHDLVFEDGWQSGQLRPGDAITVELEPQTTSSVAWCSVPGHRDAGMELEVVVRQGDDG
jgi:nitrite reductase (NO-forming)